MKVSTHLDAADQLKGVGVTCYTISEIIPDDPRSSMDDLVNGKDVGSEVKCPIGDHLA